MGFNYMEEFKQSRGGTLVIKGDEAVILQIQKREASLCQCEHLELIWSGDELKSPYACGKMTIPTATIEAITSAMKYMKNHEDVDMMQLDV